MLSTIGVYQRLSPQCAVSSLRDLRQEKDRGGGQIASKSPDEISSDSSGLLSVSITCNPWGEHTRNKIKTIQDKVKAEHGKLGNEKQSWLVKCKSTDIAVVGSTGYWAVLLVWTAQPATTSTSGQ